MALFAGSLYAESLGMNTGVTVSLPGERRDRTGDMPVLYLLHGLSDDHTSWVRRTDIDRYAEEWGVAVIMPEVQRSFYCDMTNGPRYFTYIVDELPALCQRLFRVSARREDNFVAGRCPVRSGTRRRPAFRARWMWPPGSIPTRTFSRQPAAGRCGRRTISSGWQRRRQGNGHGCI